ncbi:ATPase domain-containing protein [Desulfofundulus thermosubterraneus]|uniref:non-specific serine/threonine protein kinase n=1 Tax=Desulfofundulus thermosubterraneus DSM 16057 TaxID=1121432 RepID=A0A1M6IEF9_9FIRM|nr:ATPase domain-containing protein [Desulfofundulus thermosubterraneus]SHJ32819.1 circadian clock protein KaiC [Desulfofundulus thermosubterraneus DSM 16057]
MDTVQTGIEGLDELFYGGILRGNMVLIDGPPGAGKTTFGIEFIHRGITQFNENGLVITCEQFPESIYRDALNFGWHLRALERTNRLRVVCTSPELLLDVHLNMIEELAGETGARRVVVDSISHLRNACCDPLALRQAIYSFCNGLRRLGLTAFLIKERETGQEGSHNFEEYVVDTVIYLHNRDNWRKQRTLEVIKSRGQEHIPGRHTFKITSTGIRVFTLRELSRACPFAAEGNRLPTGVGGLDEITGGGLPPATSVVVCGSSGTGKTVLGLQFLVEGARKYKDNGLYFSLEETPARIFATAKSFGWDLHTLHRMKKVQVVYKSILEMDIDEMIVEMGKLVQSTGARRLVIDSLAGLLDRLQDPVLIKERIYYLVRQLNGLGCTSLILFPSLESNTISSVLESTTQGVILLKSALYYNRRLRHLEVYKLRGVNHATGNHLMEITASGIQVFPRIGGW